MFIAARSGSLRMRSRNFFIDGSRPCILLRTVVPLVSPCVSHPVSDNVTTLVPARIIISAAASFAPIVSRPAPDVVP